MAAKTKAKAAPLTASYEVVFTGQVVERHDGVSDLQITSGGALCLDGPAGDMLVLYAPGQWLKVSKLSDASKQEQAT